LHLTVLFAPLVEFVFMSFADSDKVEFVINVEKYFAEDSKYD